MHDIWWLHSPEPGLLLWAKLEEAPEGRADILDSTGLRMRFDDEDGARRHLLENDYRAFDGLDADDAAALGFALGDIEPPEAEAEEDLVPLMTQRLDTGAF